MNDFKTKYHPFKPTSTQTLNEDEMKGLIALLINKVGFQLYVAEPIDSQQDERKFCLLRFSEDPRDFD